MTLCPRPILGFVFSLLMKQARAFLRPEWLKPESNAIPLREVFQSSQANLFTA
jgi:hypothetical protein